MHSLADVYRKYPVNTLSTFTRIAKRYGFSAKDAKEYLTNQVIHDQKIPPPQFMHIYSKVPNAFQMDTFINQKQSGGTNYLMFINMNSRKAYAFPMRGKGSIEVIKALNQFLSHEPDCISLLTDQDKAYLSNDVLDWMREHNIAYKTTVDEDHNKLGIINRFMRTVRDMASKKGITSNISPAAMKDIIESYNEIPHKGINYKSPNEFTEEDEQEYIKHQDSINPYKFNDGDKVRLVLDKSPLKKHRTNLSTEAYTIDSRVGNQFLIKSKDKSVDTVPGYKLVKSRANVPLAHTLKEGKRGIIQRITGYNAKSNQYNVIYEGGVIDKIPTSSLRESNPTKLSRMEREYWIKHKPIPLSIRRVL